MYTEYLGCHNSCDGQAVEDIDERLPRFDITPSFALVVESINCRSSISNSAGSHYE